MKVDNITIAPVCQDAAALYELWTQRNMGGYSDDFYDFMTTPSAARERFLAQQSRTVSMVGNLMLNEITAAE